MDKTFKIELVEAREDGRILMKETKTSEVDIRNLEHQLQNVRYQKIDIINQLEQMRIRYDNFSKEEKVYEEAIKELRSKMKPDFSIGGSDASR